MKTLKTFLIIVMVIHFAIYAISQENVDLANNYSVAETGDITVITDTQNAFIMPLMTYDKSRNAYQNVSFRPDSMVNSGWPKSASSISFYASSLLFASVLNCSYEWLGTTNKAHGGITAGLTYTMDHVFRNKYLGAHFAYTYLSGLDKNHLEIKLGGVLHFISFGEDAFKFVPVISIGYRYQPPGQKTFFRIGLSTAGIGMGYGFVFGQKSQAEPQSREDFSF